MADKRTTPDAAEDAGRRKRPAPTIDLTATEVEAAAAANEPQAGPSQPPPHSQEQAETRHDSADATEANIASHRRIWPGAAAFAGGLIGAGVMTIVLFALWFAGALPVRYADANAQVAALEKQVRDLQIAPAGATDTKSINALNERVGRIEAAITKLPASDSALAERVAAADNAMKSLGIALTALNKRSDDVTANVASARERAEAAEKAVTELRASMQDLSKNTSAGLSPAEVDAVQKRLAALERATKATMIDNAARLALSAASLRDAAASGAPFTAELNQTKSLGADGKSLAPLEQFAAGGVPAAAALAQELRALIPAMQKLSGAEAPPAGFLDRLQANAGKLVRIRPVDAPSGDDAAAVLARIEIESAHADIAGALADLRKLEDKVRAPAQTWIAKAQARQAALAAARQFAAETARTLGGQ